MGAFTYLCNGLMKDIHQQLLKINQVILIASSSNDS
jgi:hypothetical protein